MNPSSIVGHVTELCERIDTSNQPADAAAGTFFRDRRYLGSRDRRAISEAVYGIIRHRRYLETLLESYEDSSPSFRGPDRSSRYLPLYLVYAVTHLNAPREELTASTGTRWQMLYPSTPHGDFLLWIEQHADLSYLDLDTETLLGVRHSFQDWMVRDLKNVYGDETEALLQSLNTPAPTTIRVNTLKASAGEGRERLRKELIETELCIHAPAGLQVRRRFDRHTSQAFKEGWFEIQDEGSQLVSLFAAPSPGNFVIDGCAGAGGKTIHLAELMGDSGEVYAIDSERRRLDELSIRSIRAGITIVRAIALADVNPDGFAGRADVVLVDAPCSGSGTIRRNPSLKWTVTKQSVTQYASRQGDILAFNSRFVRPGGILCYATCSLFREENDDVVKDFLARHTDFTPDTIARPDTPGGSTDGSAMHLAPHRHGTDGFFAMRLRRTTSA